MRLKQNVNQAGGVLPWSFPLSSFPVSLSKLYLFTLNPISLDSISLSKAYAQEEFITTYFGIIPSGNMCILTEGLIRKELLRLIMPQEGS